MYSLSFQVMTHFFQLALALLMKCMSLYMFYYRCSPDLCHRSSALPKACGLSFGLLRPLSNWSRHRWPRDCFDLPQRHTHFPACLQPGDCGLSKLVFVVKRDRISYPRSVFLLPVLPFYVPLDVALVNRARGQEMKIVVHSRHRVSSSSTNLTLPSSLAETLISGVLTKRKLPYTALPYHIIGHSLWVLWESTMEALHPTRLTPCRTGNVPLDRWSHAINLCPSFPTPGVPSACRYLDFQFSHVNSTPHPMRLFLIHAIHKHWLNNRVWILMCFLYRNGRPLESSCCATADALGRREIARQLAGVIEVIWPCPWKSSQCYWSKCNFQSSPKNSARLVEEPTASGARDEEDRDHPKSNIHSGKTCIMVSWVEDAIP